MKALESVRSSIVFKALIARWGFAVLKVSSEMIGSNGYSFAKYKRPSRKDGL
jgi:hypothetical protein